MNKSLGDYNIEKSSSYNIKNIVWTKKKSNIEKITKNNFNKKFQKDSHKNIIYGINPKSKSTAKVFKIEEISDAEKLKNKKNNPNKKFQKASASNCNIKQGFKRPGR
ncbi:MAG: hypothetical protein K5798_07180 [Nitrosopumilus sp.]|uniref:hypothetical protein n=1 Tax=Nitrosopumilus sp. TaxID=2024843 RepID=UPI00242BB7B4|nr:hypothetical protein [Nitrosopumilus sp.]MCV0367026.1 hypothetical protein [Nitrosopumilus sp.]